MASRSALLLSMCVGLSINVGCQRPARSGPMVEGYRRASCLTPSLAQGVSPPTRGWQVTLTLATGETVTVEGEQAMGGNVRLNYGLDDSAVVAVQPGDFIYPNDIRLDGNRRLLYVKASGAYGGIVPQTWIYAYDLQQRRVITKQLVDPALLPEECQMQ